MSPNIQGLSRGLVHSNTYVCVPASPLQPSESLTLGQLLTAMRFVHAPSPESSWIWKHLQTLSMLMPFKREHLSSPPVLRVSRNGSLLFLTYLPILAPLQRHRPQACRLMRLPQPLGFYPTRVKLPSFPKFDGVPVSPLMNSKVYLSSAGFARSTSPAVSFSITFFSAPAIKNTRLCDLCHNSKYTV